ncbi:hypothetical protein M378DRAFT_120593 [Amanita muscaria Koide BX008]|uniref:SLC41A/MgtE integral membrane domain-containing protein n=1 Tax=Amanita muscaria (strain Koide BX008) TaxID=946122 RepID=A0A0C2TMT1_AMAMK|nr:hypothetical protein M378DRAFT_120593 [Amanita muscaria Koide BX008]
MSLEDNSEAIALNHLQGRQAHEDDFDVDEDDNDNAALLGSRSPTRGLERTSPSTWIQAKSLVTEAASALFLTTISLTFTGELLDHVSHWRAMRELDQLIVMIPIVLNLNGNIEMNLSARLGTAANIGELDDRTTRRSMILGNLALLQVQTIFVSFIAAGISLLLSLALPRHSTKPNLDQQVFSPRRPIPRPTGEGTRRTDIYTIATVVASAVSTASLSGLFLGTFMCALIVLCRILGLDPDNIAPAIASCLGDLVTLSLLGLVSNILFPFLHTPVPFLVFFLVTAVAISCLYLVRRNSHVSGLLLQGWLPLFGAMAISSGTGIVLDLFVSKYEGFALLAVVISGLPGALGCIYISRLSTSLHVAAMKLTSYLNLSAQDRQLSTSEYSGQPKSPPEFSTGLAIVTLLLIALPLEIAFISTLRALGWLHATFFLVASTVFFFFCAAVASLFIAHLLTKFLWKRGLDPDIYALPIHSALMDLIGQTLLVICFEIVSVLTGGRTHSSS